MSQLPLRQELPVESTWDLNLLFDTQETFENEVEKLLQKVTDFKEKYENQLNTQETIVEALEQFEAISQRMSHIVHYGFLGYEVDRLNAQYEQNNERVNQVMETVSTQLAFFEPELSQLEDSVIESVIQSEKGRVFAHYLNKLMRQKPYQLSAENEALLGLLNGSLNHPYAQYLTMKFQDLTFEDFCAEGKMYANSFVTFEGDFEGHTNQAIRHESWKSFHDGLTRYQHTAAANYINKVKTEKRLATARGFDSVIDYLLFDQRVTQEAYHRQIDVIMDKFAPVMRRYATLLKEEQGLDQMSLADIKMPFSLQPQATITQDEAQKMLQEVFSTLGEEYVAIVKRAFDERWIDFPMNQTKSTGGFCATVYDGPSYILLNWTGLLSEVLVLAHELGHAGHFQLTNENQLALTPEASLYFIEAPSTANEVIMCQYLLNQPIEAEQKRALLAEFISRTYFHNMVTHLLEADFQRKVYQAVDKNELLNADRLNGFFKETLEQFWADAVVINEGAELTWMRQPHYFMGLYPYTYSAGLTIGTQIGQRIANKDEEAIASWLEVLKAGGTLSPLELARKAGVEMADATALENAIAYVDSLLDQIEALKEV